MTEAGIVNVVDDDEGFLDSVRFLLATNGIPVRVFSTAESFWESEVWKGAGCTVLDLRMPGMGGERLLAKLADESSQPILVLTAHGSIDSAVRSLKSGAVEFLQKPCDSEVLLEKVRAAMEADVARLERERLRHLWNHRLSRLTPRERLVLEGVTRGLSSAEIASELGLQPKSVELYRSRILSKLEASSSLELVRDFLLMEAHGGVAGPKESAD